MPAARPPSGIAVSQAGPLTLKYWVDILDILSADDGAESDVGAVGLMHLTGGLILCGGAANRVSGCRLDQSQARDGRTF